MADAAHSYLDYNATAPLLPQAEAAVRESLGVFGNPSSVHGAGRRARALVEDAREQIAAHTGASTAEIVFTSGGTEANALALKGGHYAAMIVAGIEHASVLAAAPGAAVVGANAQGIVDLDALEDALKSAPRPALVAVMLANNETGVLQPLDAVIALAKTYGAFVHCDAVQALGKVPVDFTSGVDSMSLSAHKIGGLKGVGALIYRGDLDAQIAGGGQERRRRAGTENVAGIVGFGAAAREVPRLLADMPRIRALRDSLESKVRAAAPQARIYGEGTPRLANTSCFSLANVSSETQVMRLDLAGVSISAGSACSSGKIAPSHVLLAMGVNPAEAKTAVRVSLGWTTREADVARFIDAWQPLALNAAA
ncbi:MAG: cysteine desulfurase [Rhodospirillaceae bacterium]|nr:cysteine desulfurase [Rhodospirillaceae bacterium]